MQEKEIELKTEEAKFDHDAMEDVNVEGKEMPEPKSAKEEEALKAAVFQYQMVLDQSSQNILRLLSDKMSKRNKKKAATVVEQSLRGFAEVALKMTEAYAATKNINELENWIANIQGYFQGKYLIDVDPVKATKKEIKEAKVELIDFNPVEDEASEGLKAAEEEVKKEEVVDESNN